MCYNDNGSSVYNIADETAHYIDFIQRVCRFLNMRVVCEELHINYQVFRNHKYNNFTTASYDYLYNLVDGLISVVGDLSNSLFDS